jgi:hypothetical protein
VSENRTLRIVIEPKKERIAGSGRKLHNGDLHNSCSSANIRLIKRRALRTRYVIHIGTRRSAYGVGRKT